MTQEPNIFPYIAHLLQGAEVVWKPLGEVAEIKTGQTVSKNIIAENIGEYPVINSGREPLGFINTWNTDNDPIGITSRGAGVGSVTWQEGKYFRGNLNYSVSIHDSSILDTRFLYHLLLQMQMNIQALCTFQGIPALNAANLKKLPIPLPPLSVQQEIVRILDKFSQLEAKLEAKLEAEQEGRKRQYEYYRNKLLTFNEIGGGTKVEWKTLGEVCSNIFSGKNKDRNNNGLYPIYGSTGIIGKTNKKAFSGKQILVARVGANAGYVHIAKGEYDVSDNALIIQHDKNINLKFLYYILVNTKLNQYAKGGGQPLITARELKSIVIPLPPLEEQQRISTILDKFDTLVNSISEGLPKEIALRRKQYEYYREQLLSFPKG